MTEDQLRSGRPRKNSRRSSTNSISRSNSNGTSDPSQVIMDPSIDSPGSLSENHNSVDSVVSSPSKPDDPSEICALCNCGSEMALILGQLTQYSVASATLKKIDNKAKPENKTNPLEVSSSLTAKKDASKERVYYKRRRRRTKVDFDSNLPPDMTTFGTATLQDFPDILDSNQCLWTHHCCAAWSAGVCQTDSYDLENVDRAVAKALLKKCSHCQRYGASVECQVHRCNKLFHYPCCASAGAFQDITSMILLCPDHLDRTEKLADAEASCDACAKTENLNLQLFCTSCGRHFHSYCVDMTIPITPVVRMGWQCSFCKVCQGCKQPGDEDKMLCCDHCDKGYHIYCLSPPIAAVPKALWKCISCRKCEDCGAIRPGGGPSCRWHNNFTLCDRCYQQRKKGQCCPVCNRAVRLFGTADVLQCSKCFKCVHGECDPDGVEIAKYMCPICVVGDSGDAVMAIQDETNDSIGSYDYDLAATGQKIVTIEEAEMFSMAASVEFIASINNNTEEKLDLEDVETKFDYVDEKMSESTLDSPYSSAVSESLNENSLTSFPRSKRKDDVDVKRYKKLLRGRKFVNSFPRNSGDSASVTNEEDNFKNTVGSPDSTSLVKLEVPTSDIGGDDDDEGEEEPEHGLHSTVVIVSTRDSYTLKQDVCMCCGSFGKGNDGYLIGCVQCGQCFHPYCVSVKVNEVILNRGWRCLDCTVCEGCGRNADEAHLLLCDICDISFHTYCLTPPLEEVPVGGWKCQWCAFCEDCGSKDPGFSCGWMANYTQCGPCSSEQYCSICSYAYEPGNLVIQCEKCDRWLHAECDGLHSEEDATLASNMTYHCSQCRPKTKHLGIYSNLKSSIISKVTVKKVLNDGTTLSSSLLGRKTKTLHNIKARKLSRAALREQKRAELEAMPLIPLDVSANEFGTFSIDLTSVKGRLRSDESVKDRINLTDTGLKQMKSMIIRAPIHRISRKEKLSKKREETKAMIMPEEVSCSIDSTDDRPTIGEKFETPFEAEGLMGDNEVLSPDILSIKQEESMEMDMLHADTTAETDELLDDNNDDTNMHEPDPEDMTDPFEFFGVNLLEKHLHLELEALGVIATKRKIKKERKKEKRLRKAARLAESARMAFDMMKGPSVPDPTAAVITSEVFQPPNQSIEVVIPIPKPIISLPIKEEEVQLIKTEPLKEVDTLDMLKPPTVMAPPSHLDLMVDLPHVAGHEVEQLFAGIEQTTLQDITSSIMTEAINTNPIVDSPMFPHRVMGQLTSLTPSPMTATKTVLMSPTGNADAFRTVFGEDADIPKGAHQREPQKIDTQKQLKKWEIDEKLGENATISPVLYANVVHKNLTEDYPDWASRARAIARLWRKLPADQREPFRLRARDNRVKFKDKNKKASLKDGGSAQKNKMTKAKQRIMSMNMSDEKSIIDTMKSSLPVTSDSEVIAANIARENMIKSENTSKPPPHTILTVPEPQKLSPLLQNLSPSFSMASLTGLTPTTPRPPFFLSSPNTPNNDIQAQTLKTEKPDKPPKKTKPKLSKQEKELNKVKKAQNAQNMLLQEKEKQWKILQQHRIFEQQRQAILKQSKSIPLEQHPIHPSARFKATMSSTLTQDQQSFMQKVLAQQQQPFAQPRAPTPMSATGRSTPGSATGRITPSTPTQDDISKSKSPTPDNSATKSVITTPSSISNSTRESSPSSFPFPAKEVPKPPDSFLRSPTANYDELRRLEELRRAEVESLLSRPIDPTNPIRNAEQQQALLLQQQFMASQQQYIQWQLAQQEGLYGPQKAHGDKEHHPPDSEEQHQERIRFLYHQRQYHKDPYMPPGQQIPGKPPSETTTSPPQATDSHSAAANPAFPPRVPSYYSPTNTPEAAMYHQMFMEYMMRYRKGQELDPSLPPPNHQLYNSMMAEIAKQYYQRHGSFGKLFPPYMPPNSAGYPMYPPRPPHSPYDDRLPFPPYGGKSADVDPSKGVSNYPRPPFMPNRPARPYLDDKSFQRGHNMSPSQSSFPKSASFQISRIAADSTSNDEYPDSRENADKESFVRSTSQVNVNNEHEITSSRNSTSDDKKCSDGIHCGTDDEEEVSSASTKAPCPDGIHCGTDDEGEPINSRNKYVCTDGIHCGTDDEDEPVNPKEKSVCSDGIHCGTDDEDELAYSNKKSVCSDGIHCGTDDEDELAYSNKKSVCSDSIHCGTDDEDERAFPGKKSFCSDGIHCGSDDEDKSAYSRNRIVCSDGIHCGTDDEDQSAYFRNKFVCSDGIHCGSDDEDKSTYSRNKFVCSDGIHCGTDDEDESTCSTRKSACTDGIHCGTDDEDERAFFNKKSVCSDSIHCGTDDEDELAYSNKKSVCSDGIHCGTDDEDEPAYSNNKPTCSDGIHCGTDDEDEPAYSNKKSVCSDGIHCGTDDEDELVNSNKKSVGSDGIHCGTDDEDEPAYSNNKPTCSDGVHCGTDDEDEPAYSNNKPTCSDGVHCGTDDEEPAKTTGNYIASDIKPSSQKTLSENEGKQSSALPFDVNHANKSFLNRMPFDPTQNKFQSFNPSLGRNLSSPNMQTGKGTPSSTNSPVPQANVIVSTEEGHNIATLPKFGGMPPGFPGIPGMNIEMDMKKQNDSMMHSNGSSNWAFTNLSGNLNFDAKTSETSAENSPNIQNKQSALGPKPPFDIAGVRPPAPPLPGGSTSNLPTSPFSPNSSPLQKSNIISLHPGSPQYHQIFIYQHQLLIMQFQQYQFQLQLQFQQLSQQQMSPQQQFLLQQQFHQQMMLLQQQFMQQQAQLHRMAANGIQFTEHQLNAMYQQQMLTQQAYRQWVMTLPPEQQMHLQQRMQASMQQVQHQMAQIMQNARLEEEQKKKPAKPRRLNKKKSLTSSAEKEIIHSKLPVPELSGEMQMHAQRQAKTLVHSSSDSPKPSSSNIIATPTSTITQKPRDSPVLQPDNNKPDLSSNLSTTKPKPDRFIPSPLLPPSIDNKPDSKISSMNYENKPASAGVENKASSLGMPYDETSIRKQKMRDDFELAKLEMKAMSAQQKAEHLLNPRSAVNTVRPVFFPTHPSQFLQRSKPDVNVSKSGAAEKSSNQDLITGSQPNVTLPIGETPSFAARDSLNQMAAEMMRKKPYHADPMLSSSIAANKETKVISQSVTPFSVSHLLSSDKTMESSSVAHPPSDMHYPGMYSPNDLSNEHGIKTENPNYGVSPEGLMDMDGKKPPFMRPLKKNKDKEKALEEKKRLREIERLKKREEKERLRVLKEQRKVEKVQARILKQKALQEAKSSIVKKKSKVATLPIPDPPPEKPVSPIPIFTSPKSPTISVTPKIPLCEPDVHLVYPLVQPFGCSSSSSPSKMSGTFGQGVIPDVEDTYSDRPPTPLNLDTSNLLHSTTDSAMLHETLFPSPERIFKDDENDLDKITNTADSTVTVSGEEISQDLQDKEQDAGVDIQQEENLLSVSHCNHCYKALTGTVLFVDKRLEEVTEGMWNKIELSLSDQLAFCSNECVDFFQKKVKFDIEDEDSELVDAVKAAAMVTINEFHQFSPLPSDDIRGEFFAPGMDPTKANLTKAENPNAKPRWKRWFFQPSENKRVRRKVTKEELLELMKEYDVRLKPNDGIKDRRTCMFCRASGDGEANQASRLLNYNVDSWVHLNCALWSSEVYEALNGGLHNVDKAFNRGLSTRCSHCNKKGATVNCSQTFGAQQRLHCDKTFHFSCAVQSQCVFYKDKTILCCNHKSFGLPGEELRSYSVRRKVYIERDVTKQIARMLNLNNELERKEYTFRVGNLIFHELGHIPTNLLECFSTKEYVYPINFETTSIFWDHHSMRKRRYYTCSITERFRTPRFKVKVHANGTEGTQYTSCTTKSAWEEIVNNIQKQREKENLLKVFPQFIVGENLFGLSEPTVQRMIESLPGIDTIPSYNFRFGRTPILIAELPLALNPSGCVRSEKFRKHHGNRPLAIRTASDHSNKNDPVYSDDSWLTYSQRTAHILSTKSGQYRRMQKDWRNCVVLGRSRIQGLGLFVKKSVEENTFIIEYIGSLIRNEVANRLEMRYEHQNRGIYMFRIDSDVVVDATMTGGPARYINHSCDPNCVAEIVSIEGRKRIIIISNRKIDKGEELTYDYKFELEDDSSKIACLCGASNCRKWMN